MTMQNLVPTPPSNPGMTIGEYAMEMYDAFLRDITEKEKVTQANIDSHLKRAWQFAAEAVYTLAMQQASENIAAALVKNMVKREAEKDAADIPNT